MTRRSLQSVIRFILNFLAVIGFLGLLAVAGFFVFIGGLGSFDKDKTPPCLLAKHGPVLRLDTYYDKTVESHYELIARTTGFSDKSTFLMLVKDDHSPTNAQCIKSEQIVSETLVDSHDGGSGPAIRWPVRVTVRNETIEIEYTTQREQSIYLANVPIKWD